MCKCVWLCLNMPEYVWMNMPKSAWMAFVLIFPLYSMFSWMHGYLFPRLHEARIHSLKEHRVAFSFLFVFYFRLNSFVSEISYLLLHLWAKEGKGQWPSTLIYVLSEFDEDCKNISGTVKHCLDIEILR